MLRGVSVRIAGAARLAGVSPRGFTSKLHVPSRGAPQHPHAPGSVLEWTSSFTCSRSSLPVSGAPPAGSAGAGGFAGSMDSMRLMNGADRRHVVLCSESVLAGQSHVLLPADAAVPSAAVTPLRLEGSWDRRIPQHDMLRANEAAVSGSMAEELLALLETVNLDGGMEWEELQAGSVVKKRKKAMNKHKWKKRRKRDRSYAR
ncbi:MAG: AURKAIP1/COX24 domain-containing protein [Promethearchaeia archaeon]